MDDQRQLSAAVGGNSHHFRSATITVPDGPGKSQNDWCCQDEHMLTFSLMEESRRNNTLAIPIRMAWLSQTMVLNGTI